MEKPEKCDDAMLRLMYADCAQKFIDDLDNMYPDGDMPEEQINNLKKYFNANDIPIPIFPNDERRLGVIKTMYRVWAALECNNLVCSLMGIENKDD